MKFIFMIFLFSTINCKLSSIDSGSQVRQKAINLVLKSKELKQLYQENDGVRVSNELIPFYEIGFLFRSTLDKSLFPDSEFADLDNFNIKIDDTLQQLSTNQESTLQIFFSSVENNFFIVEVFSDASIRLDRKNIPDTGNSIGYMFKIDENSVELVDVKIIYYG